MKKMIVVLTCMLLLQSGAVFSGSGEGTVKIGALYSTTGGQSSLDGPSLKGARLAVKHINALGGLLGKRVELIHEDAKTDETATREAMTRLVQDPEVAAVIGLSDSNFALTAGRIAQKAGVVFLTSGATLPSLPDDTGEYVFMAAFGDNAQAAAIAEYAYNTIKGRTAWILTEEPSVFTAALTRYFLDRYRSLAGPDAIMGGTTYPSAVGDLTSQTAELKALKAVPQVIMISSLPDQCGDVVGALRRAGFQGPIVSGDGCDTELLFSEAGKDAHDVFVATHVAYDDKDANVGAFVRRYEKEYGEKPENAFAALGYDALNMIAEAIERAESTEHDAVRLALGSLRMFEGVTGNVTLSCTHRVPDKSVTIVKASEGKFVFEAELTPAP